MKKGLTEMIFILDRSGSMGGLEKDTIGGFNNLIQNQKAQVGEAIVTTVLFDNHYDVIHNHLDLKEVPQLTDKEYYPRGMTALLDAVCKTILTTQKRHQSLPSDSVPENTIVIITTDGHENASKQYNYHDAKTLINKQKEIYNWEFIFLGANIDSEKEASKLGIRKERATNYKADKRGVDVHYEALSKTVGNYRRNKVLNDDWADTIKKDNNSR